MWTRRNARSIGLIDGLIEREGGYVNHPADSGGPTRFGITEAVARAHGYAGAMAQLPREEAAAIYRRLYWLRPRFDEIARRAPRVAAELFDTGANMGPAVATTFLQRALTALNRNGRDYPDLAPDGRIGDGRPWPRSTASSKRAASAAARPCCCARSKRCRASATSASPSAGPPMRPSSTAGSRTGLVNDESHEVDEVEDPRFHSVEGDSMSLPPPDTFAEGQRLVYGLLAAAAGMFCGLCAVAMIALLMWGGWSAREEHSIVIIFGWSLGGFIAAMVAVIVGLLAGGPVGRFKVAASRDGASLEANAERQ